MKSSLIAVLAVAPYAFAQSIAAIQGNSFLSPYAGQSVTNVSGIITAKGTTGIWITSRTPDSDDATSDSVYVYTTSATILASVAVGDEITLNGKVSEYISATYPSDLHLTEIGSPTSIKVLSRNNTITPIVLGRDRSPPTTQYSALDSPNVFSVPGNTSLIENGNTPLQPDKYGVDFWESLEGALVTVPSPVAMGLKDSYGEFWVHGAYPVTGLNSRGGLSITINASGAADRNPEAIMIGAPLDGTKNPTVILGTTLSDVTGVVTYAYDYYMILPVTAPTVLSMPSYNPPPTTLQSSPARDIDNCQQILMADYNLDNFTPTETTRIALAATHIVKWLGAPDILWLQEIQDNDGAKGSAVVNANLTLSTLVAAIVKAGGPAYSFAQIDPINGTNGGEDGGNIRPAFLFKPTVLSLVNVYPGDATIGTTIVGSGPNATLSLNPGLVDPTNSVFVASRKPLAALFQAVATGAKLWAINVHQSSKYGSSPMYGSARPPINGAVDSRIAQAKVTANFISQIIAADKTANVILAGDFNDYRATTAVFQPFDGLMYALDELANIPPVERYTYVFDMNSQQLDHVFVSNQLAQAGNIGFEHVHVSTWANSTASSIRVSDHDPSVGSVKLCHEY